MTIHTSTCPEKTIPVGKMENLKGDTKEGTGVERVYTRGQGIGKMWLCGVGCGAFWSAVAVCFAVCVVFYLAFEKTHRFMDLAIFKISYRHASSLYETLRRSVPRVPDEHLFFLRRGSLVHPTTAAGTWLGEIRCEVLPVGVETGASVPESRGRGSIRLLLCLVT